MSADASARSPWLLRPPDEAAPQRLFCLPYSGCGASSFHRWPTTIGATEVCPVQLPGRENRLQETIPATYAELAEQAIEGLEPWLDRPTALFGHCGSALLAYEIAIQLAEQDRPARLLVISSEVAPQDGPYGRFLGLDDTGLRHELEKMTRRFGSEPIPALLEMSLTILRQDLAANAAYHQPSRPSGPGCRLVSLGWESDVEIPPELMAGWPQLADVSTHRLAGDHFAFLDAPQELLNVLLTELTLAAASAVAGGSRG